MLRPRCCAALLPLGRQAWRQRLYVRAGAVFLHLLGDLVNEVLLGIPEGLSCRFDLIVQVQEFITHGLVECRVVGSSAIV